MTTHTVTKYLYFFFLVLVLSALGCQDDSVMDEINEMEEMGEVILCPPEYDADTIFLTQGTLDIFPYQSNYFLESIFFESIDGNRVSAEKQFSLPKISYGGRWPNTVQCVHDSLDQVRVNLYNEIIGNGLIISDLNLDFSIGYRVRQDMERYEDDYFHELGSIFVSPIIDDPYFINPIPQITLVLQDENWPRNLPNPLEPNSELILNDKVYNSVYVNDLGNDKFEIYYNF